MTEQQFRYFYRIVHRDSPDAEDFTSNLVLGKRIPDDPEQAALWDGLSVQSTLAQARRRGRASPGLGRFIAVMQVPMDGSIRFERTLNADGHHTIWGDPDELRMTVVSVEPVRPVH